MIQGSGTNKGRLSELHAEAGPLDGGWLDRGSSFLALSTFMCISVPTLAGRKSLGVRAGPYFSQRWSRLGPRLFEGGVCKIPPSEWISGLHSPEHGYWISMMTIELCALWERRDCWNAEAVQAK